MPVIPTTDAAREGARRPDGRFGSFDLPAAPASAIPTASNPHVKGWVHNRVECVALDENGTRPDQRVGWGAFRQAMPYMSDARLAEVESRSRGDLGFALNNLLDDEEQEDAALVTLGDAAINGWTDAESDHVVAAFVVADRGWAKERSAEPWPEDECRRILTELGQFDDFDLDQLTTAGQMWQASPQPLATAYANGTLSARGVMAVVYRADSPQHHAGHNLPSDPEDPRRRHGAVRNLLGTVASRIP